MPINERPRTPKPDVQPTATATCTHLFQFMRQESRNDGYAHLLSWTTHDVFFCTRCLERREVRVRADYAEFTGPRNERVR